MILQRAKRRVRAAGSGEGHGYFRPSDSCGGVLYGWVIGSAGCMEGVGRLFSRILVGGRDVNSHREKSEPRTSSLSRAGRPAWGVWYVRPQCGRGWTLHSKTVSSHMEGRGHTEQRNFGEKQRSLTIFFTSFLCDTWCENPVSPVYCSKYLHYSTGSHSQTGISLNMILHSIQTGGGGVTHHQGS